MRRKDKSLMTHNQIKAISRLRAALAECESNEIDVQFIQGVGVCAVPRKFNDEISKITKNNFKTQIKNYTTTLAVVKRGYEAISE